MRKRTSFSLGSRAVKKQMKFRMNAVPLAWLAVHDEAPETDPDDPAS